MMKSRRWRSPFFEALRLEKRQGLLTHGISADLDLQEAGCSWESFLEQLKGIVVVQNVDGVRQGEQLLGLSLADLGPLFLLGGAGLLQLSQELFVVN
jgi:hypothetical protein